MNSNNVHTKPCYSAFQGFLQKYSDEYPVAFIWESPTSGGGGEDELSIADTTSLVPHTPKGAVLFCEESFYFTF